MNFRPLTPRTSTRKMKSCRKASKHRDLNRQGKADRHSEVEVVVERREGRGMGKGLVVVGTWMMDCCRLLSLTAMGENEFTTLQMHRLWAFIRSGGRLGTGSQWIFRLVLVVLQSPHVDMLLTGVGCSLLHACTKEVACLAAVSVGFFRIEKPTYTCRSNWCLVLGATACPLASASPAWCALPSCLLACLPASGEAAAETPRMVQLVVPISSPASQHLGWNE